MPFLSDRLAEQRREQNREQEFCAARHATSSTPSDDDFSRVAVGKLDAARVTNHLRKTIFGQDEAIDAVFRTLTVAQAGLSDPMRPIASHLFVGPTGTGKTEVVRQVAAALRTGPEDFCQVDMSAMAQEHYAASLSGAPPGYAGSKESHSIFDVDKITGSVSMPGIVLFDEVEKAHRTVLLAMLHVLDRGTLTLANGQQELNFRNCIVFMTSNLGSRDIQAAQSTRLARLRRLVNRRLDRGHTTSVDTRVHKVTRAAVTDFFDPEFLNRVDETTIFSEIGHSTAVDITRRELDAVVNRVSRRGVEVSYTDLVVEQVIQDGFDVAYGARSVRRTIHRDILPILAIEVVSGRVRKLAGDSEHYPIILDHGPNGYVTRQPTRAEDLSSTDKPPEGAAGPAATE